MIEEEKTEGLAELEGMGFGSEFLENVRGGGRFGFLRFCANFFGSIFIFLKVFRVYIDLENVIYYGHLFKHYFI